MILEIPLTECVVGIRKGKIYAVTTNHEQVILGEVLQPGKTIYFENLESTPRLRVPTDPAENRDDKEAREYLAEIEAQEEATNEKLLSFKSSAHRYREAIGSLAEINSFAFFKNQSSWVRRCER